MTKKITELDPIVAGDVDRATDVLELADVTASASKKVTPNALMNITGNAVGDSDTQTLTNKTLTAPTISGPTLSGTVIGTYTLGGTPTFPAAVVTLTGSQTLTNKTLTSPTINTATIVNPTLTVDAISEFTGANGVSIDGLNIKDSKLNTNNSVVTANITDDAVTAAKIDWAATGANAGIWWEELGRTTAAGGETSISVSIASRKYLLVRYRVRASASITDTLRFNADSGNNYSRRVSDDGGADSTAVSQSGIGLGASNTSRIGVMNIDNVAADEKLLTGQILYKGTLGAGTAPNKTEITGVWANTSAVISAIAMVATSGSYAAGTELVVLGHN